MQIQLIGGYLMFKKLLVTTIALLLSGCAGMMEYEKRSEGLSAYPTVQYEQFMGNEIVKSYETSRVTKPYDKLKMKACLYEVVKNDVMLDYEYGRYNQKRATGVSGGGRIIDKVKSDSAFFQGNFEQLVYIETPLGSSNDNRHVLYNGLMFKDGENKTTFIFSGLRLHSGLSEHPLWSRKMNVPEKAIEGLNGLADDIADCLNDK